MKKVLSLMGKNTRDRWSMNIKLDNSGVLKGCIQKAKKASSEVI